MLAKVSCYIKSCLDAIIFLNSNFTSMKISRERGARPGYFNKNLIFSWNYIIGWILSEYKKFKSIRRNIYEGKCIS